MQVYSSPTKMSNFNSEIISKNWHLVTNDEKLEKIIYFYKVIINKIFDKIDTLHYNQ